VFINFFRSAFTDEIERVETAPGTAIKDIPFLRNVVIDWNCLLIYVNGFQKDENYILSEDDVCTARNFPSGFWDVMGAVGRVAGAVLSVGVSEAVIGIVDNATKNENAKMLEIIRKNFKSATVMLECLAKRWVNREKIEKSIQNTGAKFIFGADSFEDIADIAGGFRKIKDDNITRGMIALHPVLKLFEKLPVVEKMTEKILVFETE